MAVDPHASAYLLPGQTARRERARLRLVPPPAPPPERTAPALVRRVPIANPDVPVPRFRSGQPCDAVRLRSYVDGAVAAELAVAWGVAAATAPDPAQALHAWYQQAIWQVVASTLELPSWPDAPAMWRPVRDALVAGDLATGPAARLAAATHDLAGCTPAHALRAGVNVARAARMGPPPPRVVDLQPCFDPDPQDVLELALSRVPSRAAAATMPAPVVRATPVARAVVEPALLQPVLPAAAPAPQPAPAPVPARMPEPAAPAGAHVLEAGGMHLLVHDQGPAIARPWDVVTFTRIEVEFTFGELEHEEASDEELAEWAA